jgi:signal transduction histidine kinase
VSGGEFGVLAEEQAALRRVATLVARGAAPEEVFAVVTEEVARLLPTELTMMVRYEPDGTFAIIGGAGSIATRWPVGSRWPLEGENLMTRVFDSARPARVENYGEATGGHIDQVREDGIRSSVGAPIFIEGRVCGVMGVVTSRAEPLPADTEARLGSFTELVAMAISNTQARTELAASRARIVAAADETRRQIERDLHDGIQQELESLILEIRAAETSGVDEPRRQLAHAAQALEGVLEELREIAQGIHPAVLSRGGLPRALTVLARRSVIPVELDLHADRQLPAPVETAAYYATAEALTNAAKHAHASIVHVELETHGEKLRLAIHDDGIGGANLSRGSGLIGLSDRIAALGGTLQVTSPPGNGTTLLTEIPLKGHSSAVAPDP